MKTKKLFSFLGLVLVQMIFVISVARANQIQIDISSLVNADIRTYTGGTNYPVAPVTLTDPSGVNFNLVPYGSTPNSLGVIQTVTAPSSFDVTTSTSIGSSSKVYVLMNSAFGVSGKNIATLEFKAANGATDSIDIIEGTNIRDHYNDGYNNSATDILHTFNYSSDRLDEYAYTLPSSFDNTTLTDIILSSTLDAGNPNGEAFLAAATLVSPSSSVPEPATIFLLISGLIGIVAFGFRRRTE